MDESDPIEARTTRLNALQDTDPVAWAVCNGHRGPGRISLFLNITPEQAQKELDRLVEAKELKAGKYKGKVSYKPASTEMKRLARRSYALRNQARTQAREAKLMPASFNFDQD